ncbi:MAG: hypothetical protein D6736_09150 [Nitrospinota bacterium]|nr:MAG: hypothetical protein D6736_09150 [Nitrospinota bacterium]
MKFSWSSRYAHRKLFSPVPLFDPAAGQTIIEPPGSGPGWWAGAPSAFYDEERERFYLYYRLRKPLELGRGGTCCVAESRDGREFQTIWSAQKEEFASLSIEKATLIKTPEGRYRLYVSYVNRFDDRWYIDLLEAENPGDFDTGTRRTVLSPEETQTEGVKDPVVIHAGGLYYLYANFAPLLPDGGTPEARNKMHAAANAFVSGVVNTGTGLAVSRDGIRFRWEGEVLSPGTGWDAFMARLSSLLYIPPFFLAFYDGRPNVAHSYEDMVGLAVTTDLRHFTKVSVDRPLLSSRHATGALRYPEVVAFPDRLFFYYEYARPDGSHELRLNVVELE